MDETPIQDSIPEVLATPLDIDAEDFYKQEDSCYIRICYLKAQDGFHFQICNQAILNKKPEDEIPEGHKLMGTLARGMVQSAIIYPTPIYNLGLQAQNRDIIVHSDMSEDQKKALMETPAGNA